MPQYVLDGISHDIPRDAVIVDTGVVAALFMNDDIHHDEALYFSEVLGRPMLLPLCVVGEAWGLIVGRGRSLEHGLEMLRWAITPGSVILVRDDEALVRESKDLCATHHIDFVDAMLILLADRLCRQCLGSPVEIATFDMRDFLRLFQQEKKFRVYSVRDDQTLG
jgi:predicted nucleic acid-binding protein